MVVVPQMEVGGRGVMITSSIVAGEPLRVVPIGVSTGEIGSAKSSSTKTSSRATRSVGASIGAVVFSD